MKTYKLILIILIFFQCHATFAAQHRYITPYLWEVREGGIIRGYMTATFHILIDVEEFSPTFLAYLDRAEVFISETVQKRPQPPVESRSYAERYGRDHWEKFKTLLQREGLNPLDYEYAHQRTLHRMLLRLLDSAENLERILLDDQFKERAASHKKPLIALDRDSDERLQAQRQSYNKPEAITNLVDQFDAARRQARQYADFYRKGLALNLMRPPQKSEERHVAWIDRIQEASKQGRFFLAAGIFHFLGDNSLPHL